MVTGRQKRCNQMEKILAEPSVEAKCITKCYVWETGLKITIGVMIFFQRRGKQQHHGHPHLHCLGQDLQVHLLQQDHVPHVQDTRTGEQSRSVKSIKN